MFKKTRISLSRTLLIASVMLLNMSSISSAATYVLWDNEAHDGNWNTGLNWSTNSVPASGIYARIQMTAGPIFNGQTASIYRIYLDGAANGTLTMNSGTLTLGNHLYIAPLGTDRGTLNVTGGVINIGGTLYVSRDANSVGVLNLSGGTVNCAVLDLRHNAGSLGTINIQGDGKLIITGDSALAVAGYIDNGWITAYDGAARVFCDYDVTTPGKTTIYTNRKAYDPSPADNTINADFQIDLAWAAGFGAVTHNIYFGTDIDDVNSAQPLPGDIDKNGAVDFGDFHFMAGYWLADPAGSQPYVGLNGDNIVDFMDFAVLAGNWMAGSIFKGNQVSTSFDPGILSNNTTYYWRIDEVNGPDTAKGNIWNFTTQSGKAWHPNPADLAANRGVHAVLTWTAGTGAASHDVYFGTQNPPPFQANQSGPLYNPGTLDPNVTYYWRVNEIGYFGTIQGDVWTFSTADPNNTLVNKIMCGYQGWFACPGDGSTRSWAHWANGAPFDYTNLKIEMWPEMSEYSQQYLTGFTLGNPPYNVFSSYNASTTNVHFRWMQEYGIDGVFVQRFGSDFGVKFFLNAVLANCKNAANTYGRKYAVMYDLTGYTTTSLVSNIQTDWLDLENNYGIATDPQDHSYIKHNGKPVIAIYGVFGDGNYPDPGLCAQLIQWFKSRGFTILIGVNNDWQNHYNTDINFRACIDNSDIIMPWNVGRYKTTADVIAKADGPWTSDLNWCIANNKEYLICVFPGYSFHNANNSKPFDEIPRRGGQFLWEQYYNAKRIGATMVYQAMFDEVDEASAIFKISNNPPPPSGTVQFLTLQGLPSDEYLWLVGEGTKMLRDEISVTATRPARP